MLKAPLCLSALLLTLAPFAGPAQALPVLPNPIAATAVESVRFEARGRTHRAAGHARQARTGQCRRCRRGSDSYAVLTITHRHRHDAAKPTPPPQKTTIRMTTDTLGPLRLRLYSSTWVERCEEKHPTFVARTGTYEAENGERERCK